MSTSLFDFIETLQNTSDLPEIQRALAAKLSEYGYHQFVYAVVPTTNAEHPIEYINLNSLNRDWMDLYFRKGLMNADYALSHALQSDRPLLWSEMSKLIRDGAMHHTMADAIHLGQDFGVRNGITVPLRQNGLYRAGVSLVADNEISQDEVDKHFFDKSEEIQTVLDVFHAFADFRAIAQDHYELTPREVEVLRWLSEGFQIKQIAAKTGRSESTLEKQVISARLRMRAATTVQAVTKAALLKML